MQDILKNDKLMQFTLKMRHKCCTKKKKSLISQGFLRSGRDSNPRPPA